MAACKGDRRLGDLIIENRSVRVKLFNGTERGTTGLDKNIRFGTIPELDPCLSGRSMLCNPALEKR